MIFDINGEYANKNLQDEGTAIFEKYKDITVRYSILEKADESFKIMKVNFYKDIETGFGYICSALEDDSGDYITSLTVIDFTTPPIDGDHFSEWTGFNRIKAIYCCCLNKAGFKTPSGFKVKFKCDASLKKIVDN